MPKSTAKVLRIAMNGVTGRMGYRQHLLRSILPIRDAGGIELADGTRVAVEPILVGRNQRKIVELAELPVPVGSRPPPPEHISEELIKLDGLWPEEVRVR